MPTEKGPLNGLIERMKSCISADTYEDSIDCGNAGDVYSAGQNDAYRNCVKELEALAPILAAKCALAAVGVRQGCVACLRNVFDQQTMADELERVPIPDEDSLRGLLECAIEAGKNWSDEAHLFQQQGGLLPKRPNPESVLREYIERSRVK